MKTYSRTEYSILNIIAGVGGYIANTVLGFICRMVFVKYLAADYLGVNGLFTNILSMLSLAELGIGGAITYALYKPLAEKDEEKIASLVKLYGTAYKVIGITIGIIGLCLMSFLKVIIKDQPDIAESIYLLYGINLFNTVITYFYSYRSSYSFFTVKYHLTSMKFYYFITYSKSQTTTCFIVIFLEEFI